MPNNDGGGASPGNKKDNLSNLITTWEELRQRIKAIFDSGAPSEEALAPLRERRANIVDRIQRIVQNNPKLRDDAIDMGFRSDLLAGLPGNDSGSGGGGGSGSDSLDNDGDGLIDEKDEKGGGVAHTSTPEPGDNDNKGNNQKGNKGGKNQPTRTDHLPGKRGKDYEIVRRGGQIYVVYKVAIKGGKHINVSWKVPKDLMDRYNIDPSKAKNISKAAFNKIENLGTINEVKLQTNRHPFRSWLEELADKFGVAPGLLRNKEVMETLLEAHVEKWDAARLTGALEQTKFFQRKTDTRRQWILETNPAQRDAMVSGVFNNLMEQVNTNFAGVDWKTVISEKRLKEIARKVASGAIGWDDQSAQLWLLNKARNTEGTQAWLDDKQAGNAVENTFENMFEQVREQATQWLGPRGKPSRDILDRWAKDLVTGKKSQSEWDSFLRRQAKALHPWLDDDEPWMDGVSSFKNIAEGILGRGLDYDDRLFSSLYKMKDNVPVNDGQTRMSTWEFEQAVKTDKRYAKSKDARDSVFDYLGLFDNVFHGVGGV